MRMDSFSNSGDPDKKGTNRATSLFMLLKRQKLEKVKRHLRGVMPGTAILVLVTLINYYPQLSIPI